MAKFCPNCGMSLDDNAGFCSGCGTKLEGPPPEQQGFVPPPPPQPEPQYAPPPPPPQQQYAPPPEQQYAPPPPPQPQQQYAPPPPPPGQQQYAPPPPQQQYAPPPPPPGQQQYAPPPGQQGYGPPPQGQQQYGPPPQPVNEDGFVGKIKAFLFNTKDETAYIHPQDIAQNKTMSGLAYIPILFFIPLVACPQSKYGRFHANQGLMLLILVAILAIIGNILRFALWGGSIYSLAMGYYTGSYIVMNIIWAIIYIIDFGLIILGFYNAFTGRARELPLIGKFRIIK